MRKFLGFFSTVLAICILFVSCATALPARQIAADHLIQIRNHKSLEKTEEIKQKVIEFITLSFVSGKDVLQVNENNIITGNWSTDTYSEGVNKYTATISFIITIKDSNINVKYVVKSLQFWAGQYGWYPLDKTLWGSFQDRIDSSINEVDQKLEQYLQ